MAGRADRGRPRRRAAGAVLRLEPLGDDEVVRLLAGDFGDRQPAPGWPTGDSRAGLGFAAAGGTVFLIIDAAGRVAGECGTKHPPRRDGAVEIGYGLAPGSRGQGLGSAAVAALVHRVSRDADVRAITAEVHLDNMPSRRIVERLGFRLVDGPVDGYVYYRLDVDPR